MNDLLNDLERALTDVMLSGFASGAALADRFRVLGADCARVGLIHGGQLSEEIAVCLENRTHSIQKDDAVLAANICKAVEYIRLCREKLQESDILARWDELTGGTP